MTPAESLPRWARATPRLHCAPAWPGLCGGGAAVTIQGVVGAAQLGQGVAQVVQRVGVLGAELEDVLVVGHGVRGPAALVVEERQPVCGIGVGGVGTGRLQQGLLGPVEFGECRGRGKHGLNSSRKGGSGVPPPTPAAVIRSPPAAADQATRRARQGFDAPLASRKR
jgi:hypothetical protein